MPLVTVRNSPSGVLVRRLVQIPESGDPTRFLNEQGFFIPVPGGSVEGIAGSGGIAIVDPMGPVATVNGSALLPRDGSRSMTGDLNAGGNSFVNVDQINGLAVPRYRSSFAPQFRGTIATTAGVGADQIMTIANSSAQTPLAPAAGWSIEMIYFHFSLGGAALQPGQSVRQWLDHATTPAGPFTVIAEVTWGPGTVPLAEGIWIEGLGFTLPAGEVIRAREEVLGSQMNSNGTGLVMPVVF